MYYIMREGQQSQQVARDPQSYILTGYPDWDEACAAAQRLANETRVAVEVLTVEEFYDPEPE